MQYNKYTDMAKIYLNRILNKFAWTGHNYRVLMSGLIADNAQRIHNSVLQVDHKILENQMKKVRVKEQALNLPRLSDVIKPQSQWTRKGADRGKLITDNLKDKLSKDLRTILDKPEYMRQRGKLTGTLKNQALLDMRETMKETFRNYTKVDPTIGIPKNIKAIVSTELRSVVNQTKQEYNQKLLQANPDIVIMKKWIHNGNVWGSNDYKARKHHRDLHGDEVAYADNFILWNKKAGTRYSVPYPHYETLPPEEVINCNCETQYRARKISKKIEKSIVEKAWQLKSGKWHDYDDSGKVVEVSAPTGEKKTSESSPSKLKTKQNESKKVSVLDLKPEERKEKTLTAEEKQKVIKSEQFKSWFGDWENNSEGASKVVNKDNEPQENYHISKVADKDGNPITVYHGTATGGYEEFSKDHIAKDSLYGAGFYFTEDKEIADEYRQKDKDKAELEKNKEKTYEVFLNIKKPFDVDNGRINGSELPKEVREKLTNELWRSAYNNTKGMIEAYAEQLKKFEDIPENKEKINSIIDNIKFYEKDARISKYHLDHPEEEKFSYIQISEDRNETNEILKKSGYDGLTHIGGKNIGIKSHRVWISFEPEQIKATTSEKFDRENKNIYKSEDIKNITRKVLKDILNNLNLKKT